MIALLSMLAVCSQALAGGPRFVTGAPYFTAAPGQAIGWKQPTLLYYTDPGALSATVNHQAADALVAAAAGVWNVPQASITVAQGGALAEHVSGQNVYLDSEGLQFPADVMASNAAQIPVAVIYDTDGSVTDLLLGSGASQPSGCRNNGVTSTVDSFDPAGFILHAMVIVNGRCSGAAAAQQYELQYQLERQFGRILGLAWSQTNDNVFTGTPTPTYAQASNWPIMHPLDIVCGTYTYQCLPNPFQLRPDDIAGLVSVYPNAQGATLGTGKQVSLANAQAIAGTVSFPTGEGMAGVNVVATREQPYGTTPDAWQEASGVTGQMFLQAATSPFVTAADTAQSSFGTAALSALGEYNIAYVPVEGDLGWDDLIVSTEPVNRLYSGTYTVGPYSPGVVQASGSPQSWMRYFEGTGATGGFDFTVPDAASTCGQGQDGTADLPIPAPATGWWQGLLCPYGHAAYVQAVVQPGRTFTVEVTALDATGAATESKMMPVIGLFASTDAAGALPSLGVAGAAFQSAIFGMTSVSAATGDLTSVRVGIADQRDDGRPDFNYQARLFYADSVMPNQIVTKGGTITISGMGLRAGNAVTINGVTATVTSWSTNTIVLTAPSMIAAKATLGQAVDVVVKDLSSGASSTIAGSLTYTSAGNLPNIMRLVSAPAGTLYDGDVAATLFSVQVLAADGVTPIVNTSVTFAVMAGSAQFSVCNGSSGCVVATNAQGIASTGVVPQSAGTVTIEAVDGALSESTTFSALAQAGSLLVWQMPSGNVPVGQDAGVIDVWDRAPDYSELAGRAVTFSVQPGSTGSVAFQGCASSVCTVLTNSSGIISLDVVATAVGAVTIQVADGDVKQSFSFMVVSNTDVMTIASAPPATTFVGGGGEFTVNLLHADGVTPDTNETVIFTAPPGVLLYPCVSTVCPQSSSWDGQPGVGVDPQQTGTVVIQAAYGAVTQSVTMQVVPHTAVLRVVSVPASPAAVGAVAPTPFAVQLLNDGTTPIAGALISIGAPPQAAQVQVCPNGTSVCYVQTDSNGIASTGVTPLTAGLITLSAAFVGDSVSASFNATGPGKTMTVTQQPGPGGVFVGDSVRLAVQVMAPGGLTPLQGDLLQYAILSGPFGFTDWYTTTVLRQTDSSGMAYEVGAAGGAGTVAIQVTDGTVSQIITFNASVRLDQMTVLSAPASGGTAGQQAATPFSVQVLLPDGVTPAVSRAVTISVTNGSATLAGCGSAASCVLVTDAQGMVSTLVTPLAAGTVTLQASEGGVAQSASFSVEGAVLPDVLTLVSTPGPSVYVGATAVSPLQAQVTLADGVTPVAGVPVTFSLGPQSAGGVAFSACPAASCTVVTNAGGVASTAITGVTAGAVTLIASAALPSGTQTVSTALQVQSNQWSVTPLTGTVYLLAGASEASFEQASVIEDGQPAGNAAITWTAATGAAPATPTTVTTASGATANDVLFGPLAAGARASVTACQAPGICAEFDGVGVGAAALQLALVSGAGQSVSGSATPVAVEVVVQDGAGHPVGGAPVSIYQTISALTTCPASGRCPAAEQLGSQASVVVSGADGTVSVQPLTIAGTATETQILFTAGTQATASAVVTVRP